MIWFLSNRASGSLVLGVLLLTVCRALVAAADGGFVIVVDLDGLAGGGNPEQNSLDVDEHRFTGSPQFHAVASPAAGSLPLVDHGSPYIASLGGGDDGPITLSRLDGLPFSLIQFDAAEAFLSDVEATLAGFPNAASINVVGQTSSGGQVQTTFTLDGVKDGAAGQNDFQTFTLDASFTNLASITFHGSVPTGGSGAFALDNFHLGTPIPEPATLPLALVALSAWFITQRVSRRPRLA